LGVLYGGRGIIKLQFLFKKFKFFFPAVKFLQCLVIKTLVPEMNPDPKLQLDKMLDLDPH
jgi:hypothetical protein